MSSYFILQQPYVLAELVEYIESSPEDKPCQQTLQNLQAVNKLFEEGILSHNVVNSMECTVIKNMDEGYLFFRIDWIHSLIQVYIRTCAMVVPVTERERNLMSVHVCMYVCMYMHVLDHIIIYYVYVHI